MQDINQRFGSFWFCMAVISACTEKIGNTQMSYDGSAAEGEAESESGDSTSSVICEEAGYTQAQVDEARGRVFAAWDERGTPAEPIIWEDEVRYGELVRAIVEELGCLPEEEASADQSTRRNGQTSCEVVTGLRRFDPTALYCGPGARRGVGCGFPWFNPGRCMNEVCYYHDRCYADLIAAQGAICIWNSDTSACDNAFHLAGLRCAPDVLGTRQAFWYLIVNSIAVGLETLEVKARLRGLRCLLGTAECEDGEQRICSGTEVGECRPEIQRCVSGRWGQCEGAVGPDPEVCDGFDNDCDGSVDEELGSTTCGTGPCARTVDNCVGGFEQTCVPGASAPEICDGLDNDCDREADEDFREPLAEANGHMALGTECAVGSTECGTLNTGVAVCTPDGLATVCDADPLPVCNGRVCGHLCGEWCTCAPGMTCDARCNPFAECAGRCIPVGDGCTDGCPIRNVYSCVFGDDLRRFLCQESNWDECLDWTPNTCEGFCDRCLEPSEQIFERNPCRWAGCP